MWPMSLLCLSWFVQLNILVPFVGKEWFGSFQGSLVCYFSGLGAGRLEYICIPLKYWTLATARAGSLAGTRTVNLLSFSVV